MTYHNNHAISQSKLKDLKRSPSYFYAKHIAMSFKEPETDAMKFGSAIHAYILEHHEFVKKYISAPMQFNKRTKSGKEDFEKFTQEHFDKTVLSFEEMKLIKNMQNSLMSKRLAKTLLSGGEAEKELYWVDPDSGVSCKGKLDYWIEPCDKFPNGIIVDVKTTINADPEDFIKTIANFGYYNQLAFYCEGVKHVYKTDDYPLFIFIAIEKTDPYQCSFLTGDREMLEYGLKDNAKLLKLYKKCIDDNKWGGFGDMIQTVSLPRWAIKYEENL